MSKVVFNYETLTFEKVKFSFTQFLKSFLPHLFLTLLLGSGFGYVLYSTTETPTEKRIKKENSIIEAQLNLLNSNLRYQSQRLSVLEDRDNNVYRTALMLDPIPQTKRMLGGRGYIEMSDKPYLSEDDSKLLKEIKIRNSSISNRVKTAIESYQELTSNISNRDQQFKSKPSIWPIPKKSLKYISSRFGYRMHPTLHVRKMHTGVDLSANIGVPVYATADGIVMRADNTASGYGNHIRISHGPNGYTTFYAHLSKMFVVTGEVVHRGQLIGLVGNSGRSTGPHLHYEVRFNGRPINPMNFLYDDMTDEQYQQLVSNQPSGSVSAQ